MIIIALEVIVLPTVIRSVLDGSQKNLLITKKPDKMKYKIGERLDFTGIELSVKFNGKIKNVTLDKITFTPSAGTYVTKEMSDIITISYKEQSNSDPIEIPLIITKIEYGRLVITGYPLTTTYHFDEEFRWDETKRSIGLSIEYTDGSMDPFAGNIIGHNLGDKFIFTDTNNGESYYKEVIITTDYVINVKQTAILRLYCSNKPKIITPGMVRDETDWKYVVKMIEGHEKGLIDIKDYWKVGDKIGMDINPQITGWPTKIDLIVQGFDYNIYGLKTNIVFGMKQVVNIGTVSYDTFYYDGHPTGNNGYIRGKATWGLAGVQTL